MAETMLFVNDHINAELWDGPEDPQPIRNFAPGDYIVFETADGDSVMVSGHPAERGTFNLFLRAFDVEHLADDPRFVDVASRKAHIDALRQLLLDAARTIPDAATFEARCSANHLAVGRMRSARDLADSDWAAARGAIAEVSDRGGGTIRIPNPPWHFSGAEVGVRGEAKLPGRGQPRRARRRARLRRRHHRRPRGRRGAVQPGAIIARVTLSFPVDPMKATLGDAAERRRRVGLRDQVGRLPHAGVRRRRRGAAAELEPPRRDGASTRSWRRWPTASAPGGPCSTASSSSSTTSAGPASS